MKPSELKKFIRTSSGTLLNTDFIVCIQNYYGNYWFTMVDGMNYEVDRNEETEFLVEYLTNQSLIKEKTNAKRTNI